ncbi:MAG: cytochrome P450 [Actinomycetota bacterium]|nr:cytochrome P450 [Actinomycetota bacterium]
MSELLGVPDQLGQDLRRRAAEVVGVFAPPGSDQAGTAEAALADWVSAALDAEDAHGGGGLLSSLLSSDASSGGSALSNDEVRNVVLTLLLGGLIPPAQALGRWAAPASAPTRAGGPPAQRPRPYAGRGRRTPATRPCGRLVRAPPRHRGPAHRLGGGRAGEVVVVSLGAVNRDPSRFIQSHRLDPERAEPSHLSFAAGAHRCLGASITRTQLLAALHAVLTCADPHLAVDEEQLQWRPSFFTDLPSVTQLPLAWRPQASP